MITISKEKETFKSNSIEVDRLNNRIRDLDFELQGKN